MLVILFDLKFSGELALTLELISHAAVDFIFFILMFIKVIFAFAITGYLLFGT